MSIRQLVLVLSLLAMPLKASAYVDFGTGSMIVQSILAGTVGVGFFFKDKLISLLTLFKKDK